MLLTSSTSLDVANLSGGWQQSQMALRWPGDKGQSTGQTQEHMGPLGITAPAALTTQVNSIASGLADVATFSYF